MVISESLLFALSLINTAVLLFLLVYFVITLSDLECDYLNAQQCCTKLNFWVKPKIVIHGGMCLFLLLSGHWVLVLANIPLTGYMIYEIRNVPKGNIGVYEPTEIYFHGRIKKYMKECFIHLGYLFILFFTYLYCMITAILRENPVDLEDDLQLEF